LCLFGEKCFNNKIYFFKILTHSIH
jgi:hypothetical protein